MMPFPTHSTVFRLLSSTEISGMAVLLNTVNTTTSLSNLKSLSFLNSFPQKLFKPSALKPFPIQFSSRNFSTIVVCHELNKGNQIKEDDNSNSDNCDGSSSKKKLSEQSSWESKDSKGNDYLYRLGSEADNMNIAVGAKSGVIDHLFTGNFLGKDSDIVFDYRQKVTRSFEYLQGDYYIAPLFLDKVGKLTGLIQTPKI